ncbi:MAG: SDR family oxidoreductase [Ottowia sp.]|nr:SDR family oxidoreductase [Ottowia sp.]
MGTARRARECDRAGILPHRSVQKLWAQPGMGEWAKQVTPLERLGDMKELVGAAVFLASHAAGFITGQILRVDGGISAGMNWPIEL